MGIDICEGAVRWTAEAKVTASYFQKNYSLPCIRNLQFKLTFSCYFLAWPIDFKNIYISHTHNKMHTESLKESSSRTTVAVEQTSLFTPLVGTYCPVQGIIFPLPFHISLAPM